MRPRLEVLAAVLAVGGAALAVQQAFSVPGDLLPAGLYLSILGAALLVIAGGRSRSSRITRLARVVTALAVVVAISFGLLAVHLCGPTVLLFDCRA